MDQYELNKFMTTIYSFNGIDYTIRNTLLTQQYFKHDIRMSSSQSLTLTGP